MTLRMATGRTRKTRKSVPTTMATVVRSGLSVFMEKARNWA